MLVYAAACTLPLGTLAIVAVLFKAREHRVLKVIAASAITSLLFLCCSSVGLSPYGVGAPSPIVRPSTFGIAGIYYLTNSPDYLRERGYPALPATSLIELRDDQTFRIEQMPDLVIDEHNAESQFLSGEGTWRIRFDTLNEEWYLGLNFTELNDKPSAESTYLWLYGARPPFVLYSILGHPDSYDWLMYRK
jgi:hypothetical protein